MERHNAMFASEVGNVISEFKYNTFISYRYQNEVDLAIALEKTLETEAQCQRIHSPSSPMTTPRWPW